jgi:hypothetical protein
VDFARDGIVRNADANGQTLGILVFAGVRLAIRRVQEKTSTPQTRLAYTHLSRLLKKKISAAGKRVAVAQRHVNEIRHDRT